MLLSQHYTDPQLSPIQTLTLYNKAVSRRDDDRFYQRWLIAIQNGNKDSYTDFKEKAIRRSTTGLTNTEKEELGDLFSVLQSDKVILKKKK